MKKQLNLVLLPTNNINPTQAPLLLSPKNKLVRHAAGGEFRRLCSIGYEPQQLYAISDKKPKAGDYFIELDLEGTRSSYSNKVYKCDIGVTDNFILSKEINFPFPENCRKIIITTDESLDIFNVDSQTGDSTYRSCYPTFTNDFIDTYIERYNNEQILEQVNVEYEEYGEELGCDPAYYGLDPFRLKINSDNTVNVSLIEDKLYTKEEVIEFTLKCLDYFKPMNAWSNEEAENHVKQNL